MTDFNLDAAIEEAAHVPAALARAVAVAWVLRSVSS
jgi:hypothetical protein